MEILIALVPMLAWGSIGLVSGKIGGDANQQTLGMTIGAFLFSLVVFFVVSPVITPWIFLIGFLIRLREPFSSKNGHKRKIMYTVLLL